MTTRSRNFSLTVNNPTMPCSEYADLLSHEALYSRVQAESGEQETLHFQACVGYKNARTLASVIKQFKGAHVEVTRNAQAAWDYCGKEDTRIDGPYSHGLAPPALHVKGAKAKSAIEIIEMGADAAIAGNHIRIHDYGKVLNNIQLFTNRNTKIPGIDGELQDHNIWYWGLPGSGKTSKALADYPDLYEKDKSKFWNGYVAQETILVDDLEEDETFMLGNLKKWAQHKPFQAEDKFGQMRPIRPVHIIVTSNHHPHQIWSKQVDQKALDRRFKVIEIKAQQETLLEKLKREYNLKK